MKNVDHKFDTQFKFEYGANANCGELRYVILL